MWIISNFREDFRTYFTERNITTQWLVVLVTPAAVERSSVDENWLKNLEHPYHIVDAGVVDGVHGVCYIV